MGRKYTNKLEGKRILIFGGSSGIGLAIAEACLEHGATIFISSSNATKLARVRTQLHDTYPDIPQSHISTHACDLAAADAPTQESNIRSLLDAVTANATVKLDHIVHTAGDALALSPLASFTRAHYDSAATVRLVSVLYIGKLAPAYMQRTADSSITLTTGVTLKKPQRGWAAVLAAAGGVDALARALAVEMAPVRVNAVAPGLVVTPLVGGMSVEVLEGYRMGTVTGRLGRGEDVAEAYLYCMKDGFVTGAVIESSGGALLK